MGQADELASLLRNLDRTGSSGVPVAACIYVGDRVTTYNIGRGDVITTSDTPDGPEFVVKALAFPPDQPTPDDRLTIMPDPTVFLIEDVDLSIGGQVTLYCQTTE